MRGMITASLIICLGCIIPAAASGQTEETVSDGKTVTLEYTLSIQGNVVETSEGHSPLVYVHGRNAIIPGLEKELEGMRVGEEKTFTIPPEEGYGQVNPNSFILYDKSKFTKNVKPRVGLFVEVPTKDGRVIPAAVVEVRKDTVMLNFNHPLAGFDLTFHVKIINIK